MKKLFVLILAVALISSVSLAEASFFDVDVEVVDRIVGEEGYSKYNVTIYNFDSSRKIFSNSLSPAQATSWSIIPTSIVVPGDDEYTFELKARPRTILTSGSYSLEYIVRSDGESVRNNIPVRIPGEGAILSYPASVDLFATATESINPTEDFQLELEIRNRNRRDLENLAVVVDSQLFNQEIDLSLEPLGAEKKTLQLQIDDLQEPGNYRYHINIYHGDLDTLIHSKSLNLEVERYSTITPELESSTSWFKTTETIKLENKGNYEREKEIALRSPWYQRIFLSTDEPYEVVTIDGRANVQFKPMVQAGDTYEIDVYRNYRPLAVLVVLAILAVISYYAFRSPITMRKEVFMTGTDNEGVKEFKVRIYLKNRSGNPVNEVKVTDYLPRITEYVKKESQGAITPDKVTKTSRKGVLLNWELEKVESLEERILTYNMKSTLGIVGNLTLPRANVKFKDFKERIRKSKSSEAAVKK